MSSSVRVTLNEKDQEIINLAFDILLSDYGESPQKEEILKDVTAVLEKISKQQTRKVSDDQ